MKTRRETLEAFHDYVMEDIIRVEIKIRNFDGRRDDEILKDFERRTLAGKRQVTKKEFVEEQQKEIVRLKGVLKTIEKIINEEDEKGNHATKEQKKKRSGVE